MKISEKIKQILNQEEGSSKIYYSFEYFPPKTESGVENLLERIERMGSTNPLWVDVTWNAGGVTSEITLDLCSHIQNYLGLDVLMHLTCTYMTKEKIIASLEKAKEYGIKNILALRGDPPRGATDWIHQENGFNYAIDLVKFIRENFGDYFCIVVAGYPEVHLQATSRNDDIIHLKNKVDAGADFIITQLFYDNKIYMEWVDDCRKAGISCPIIPGIMPILGYDRFHRMLQFTKTIVPEELLSGLEPLKQDDEEVRKYGIKFCVQQCQELIQKGYTKFIHLYTMNLEKSVIDTLKGLGIIDYQKSLPFKKSAQRGREKEEVRPIFWAIKPKSYIQRTQEWDEFPNGRWGPSRSPAFGITESYMSMSKNKSFNFEEKQKLWGKEISNLKQVADLFIRYLTGKLKKFPFSEGSLQPETAVILDPLIKMNNFYLFTINSQPRLNGISSNDPKFGWGPQNGYVYQKAYYEFFIHPDLVDLLIQHLNKFEMITYQAVNIKNQTKQNVDNNDVNAVTWGVFRGKEIIQPTVVDHQSFIIWKDEAFTSWIDEWALIYGSDTPSYKYLKNIHDTFYLMNVVDNDYIGGDLNAVFAEFFASHQEFISSL